MLNVNRLNESLKSALPTINGIMTNWGPSRNDANSTYYQRADTGTIRVLWTTQPTPQQDQQAAAIVAAFDPTPTEGERLDTAGCPARALVALLIRQSSSWSALSAVKQAHVQAIIDEAASGVLQALQG